MENGGPGTVFLYHLVHTHRTLLIDNNGGKPLNKHINYGKLDEEGKLFSYVGFTTILLKEVHF